MKKRTKKLMSILLISAMSVSMLAGCGGTSSETTGTDSNTSNESVDEASGGIDKNMTADITVGGWPSGDDAFNAALAGFNEEYPNITVELQFTDTTSHHQALQTALAAGTGAPDVAMVEGAYIAQYRDSSALTNLYDAPYNAGDLKDDFVSFKWDQAVSSDGSRLVAIPWDIGPCTYFYRTDVFEECGLPTDPDEVAELLSTWDGVIKAAEAVNIPGERWLVPDVSYFYQLLFSNRDYYDEDLNLKLERDGDLDCLNACIKMRKEGLDMNVDMWSAEAYAAYKEGTCASVATGAWFGGFLKTDIDPDGAGHWAVTTLPGGIPSCNWGGSFLVIPEQSQNKEAAWAFVNYMLGTEKAQNEMFQAVDYFPAYTPAYEDSTIYDAEDPYFGGEKTKQLWVSIANDLQPVNTTIMDATAEGQIYTSVNQGLEEGLSAEEIQSLLSDNIDTACAELKEQQIQTLKDAGVWDK